MQIQIVRTDPRRRASPTLAGPRRPRPRPSRTTDGLKKRSNEINNKKKKKNKKKRKQKKIVK